MDTICENGDVDTSYDFFGHKLTIPVMAGPVGAVAMHYSDKYDDLRYNNVLVELRQSRYPRLPPVTAPIPPSWKAPRMP